MTFAAASLATLIILAILVGVAGLVRLGAELLDYLLARHYRKKLERFHEEIAELRREEWRKMIAGRRQP